MKLYAREEEASSLVERLQASASVRRFHLCAWGSEPGLGLDSRPEIDGASVKGIERLLKSIMWWLGVA